MLVAPFTFQPVATGLATPNLLNLSPWLVTATANWGEAPNTQVTAFTSGTGNVGLLAACLGQQSTARDMVADWNGDLLTQLARGALGTSGRLIGEAGLKAGGLVGAGNVTLAAPTGGLTNVFRYLLGWLFDLDQVRGGVGGTAGTSINVNQAFVEVTLPVAAANSLLVAAGWCREATGSAQQPLTWSAGWASQSEQTVGGAAGSPVGALATKVSTTAGAETVSATIPGTSGDWALVAVEFLPG